MSIASIELLGTLLGVMLLLEPSEKEDLEQGAAVSVGGLTDNIGNRFAVARLLTTKWPLAAFVAELATQLELKLVLLQLSWVPREQNAEADAITNGVTEWLSRENRVEVDWSNFPFAILPGLLEKGREFYMGQDLVNVEGIEARPRGAALLKVVDPWDGQLY